MDIGQSVAEIRDYTQSHPELARATLFSFDVLLPKPPSGPIEAAVFGLNEAEYPGIDDAIRAKSPGILEDTSLHNFRDRQDALLSDLYALSREAGGPLQGANGKRLASMRHDGERPWVFVRHPRSLGLTTQDTAWVRRSLQTALQSSTR